MVEGASGKRYVGRFHEMDSEGLLMHDVAVFDPTAAAASWDDFLKRTLKFGVRAEAKHLVVPVGEVGPITPLSAFSG